VDHRSGCLICGKEITYLKNKKKQQCLYCRETYESDVTCIDGHFVCDKCHSLPANDLIEQTCINSKLEDPLELSLILMKNSKIKMHGPEHHFLVPAVLLSAYYNKKKDYRKKEDKIKEARNRAEKILGGFCGSHGICGAAVGTGIFISLITDATPLSEKEWKLSNQITAENLLTIAELGGPRCCKRDTFLAIIGAVKFLRKHFGFTMKSDKDIHCEFTKLNKECKKTDCMFYPHN